MSNRRKGAGVRVLLTVIAVIALLLVGFGLLFNVNKITVEGAFEYTETEIIEVSGIKTGGNLFFVNTKEAEEKIIDAFPYVTSVAVTRKLPDTLHIVITEGIARAAVEFEGETYLMDENCRVTGKVKDGDNYIKVIGLTATDVKKGSVVTVADEDETRLEFTKAILNIFGDDGYSTYVTWVDVSNIGNIKFDYMGRFTVKLGSGDGLEYKLARLNGIIQQLDPTEKGTIDISEEGKAYFDPE